LRPPRLLPPANQRPKSKQTCGSLCLSRLRLRGFREYFLTTFAAKDPYLKVSTCFYWIFLFRLSLTRSTNKLQPVTSLSRPFRDLARMTTPTTFWRLAGVSYVQVGRRPRGSSIDCVGRAGSRGPSREREGGGGTALEHKLVVWSRGCPPRPGWAGRSTGRRLCRGGRRRMAPLWFSGFFPRALRRCYPYPTLVKQKRARGGAPGRPAGLDQLPDRTTVRGRWGQGDREDMDREAACERRLAFDRGRRWSGWCELPGG